MIEARVEKYLCDRVKAAGGEVRKVKWVGRRGAPDRLVLLPTLGLFFVELKRPKGGKLAAHQEREIARLCSYGVMVLVLWSVEDVDLWLEGVA